MNAQPRPPTPGTALVRRPRPDASPLGVTSLFARVSALGLGAAGVVVKTSVDAVEKFVPGDRGADEAPTITGPMGRLLHTVPGLMLSGAYVARGGFLAVSGTIERGVVGVMSAASGPSVLAGPINRAAASVEEINRWAFGEQQHNELLVQDFVRRSAPAVAEGLVQGIDMPELVSQVPVTQIVEQIDLNAIVAQVDLNAIIARVNVRPIASQVIDELDIPGIVRATTSSLTSELIDANRVVFMHLDGGIAMGADAVIRHNHPRELQLEGYDPTEVEERPGYSKGPGGKQRTDARAKVVAADAIRSDYARERQGVRAGFASRLVCDILDVLAIIAIAFLAGVVIGFVQFLFSNDAFSLPHPTRSASLSMTGLLAFAYYTLSWTTTGRTIGDAIMGVRVVTEQGSRVKIVRAALRALLVMAVGTPMLFWSIVSKKNNALYDLIVRTTMVYDWTIN